MALSESLAPLETARLVLRAPTAMDLAALHEINADPVAQRFNPGGSQPSREAALELLQSWQLHWQKHGYGYWAIALRDPLQSADAGAAGAHVLGFGGVMAKPVDGQQGLNLCFRFRPHAWGQGYASEMSQAALELAFARLHTPAVLAVVPPANTPSRRTLERIGMRLKGSLADVPGQPPSLIYEITAAQYARCPRRVAEPTAFGA